MSEEVTRVLENSGEVAAHARELKRQLEELFKMHKDWLSEEYRQKDAKNRILTESDKELYE